MRVIHAALSILISKSNVECKLKRNGSLKGLIITNDNLEVFLQQPKKCVRLGGLRITFHLKQSLANISNRYDKLRF